jgi:hypothetical protein
MSILHYKHVLYTQKERTKHKTPQLKWAHRDYYVKSSLSKSIEWGQNIKQRN